MHGIKTVLVNMSWARIVHDFEVLARNQIRIVPGVGEFRAINRWKVHIGIDEDLLIVPLPIGKSQ